MLDSPAALNQSLGFFACVVGMSISLVGLPSLDLVRGFVAVGRHMSVTLAAQELCLTQSAVSRQVIALEEVLGVKLLRRGHRSVSLTPEGERLHRVADLAVRQLQEVVGELGRHAAARPVTVTASIGVTGLWMLPRLSALHEAHPGIDVRMAASDQILDLRSGAVDIAIRYCEAGEAPAGAVRLFGERIAAVAHPSLGLQALAPRQVVERQVLLEFDGPRRAWLCWEEQLAHLGLAPARARGTLRFNQYDQVIHAAMAGQGVALGRLPLVAPMLADGRLVELDLGGAPAQPGHAYWMVLAEASPRADVARVAGWIRAQAASA